MEPIGIEANERQLELKQNFHSRGFVGDVRRRKESHVNVHWQVNRVRILAPDTYERLVTRAETGLVRSLRMTEKMRSFEFSVRKKSEGLLAKDGGRGRKPASPKPRER